MECKRSPNPSIRKTVDKKIVLPKMGKNVRILSVQAGQA